MKAEPKQVIEECAQGALTGERAFHEIVRRLIAVGVERNGESHLELFPPAPVN